MDQREDWIDYDRFSAELNPWHRFFYKLTVGIVFMALFLMTVTVIITTVACFVSFAITGGLPDMMPAARAGAFALLLGLFGMLIRVVHALLLSRRWPTPAAYERWARDQFSSQQIRQSIDEADEAIAVALRKVGKAVADNANRKKG